MLVQFTLSRRDVIKDAVHDWLWIVRRGEFHVPRLVKLRVAVRWGEGAGEGGSLGRTPFPLTLRRGGTCGAWRPGRWVLNGDIYGEIGGRALRRSLVQLRGALTKRVS